MPSRRGLLCSAWLTALLTSALAALAVPAFADGNDAIAFLRAKHAALERTLASPASGAAATAARNEKLNAVLSELVDYDALSRRTLADHWDRLPRTQRDEFVRLLSTLVERSYQSSFDGKRGYSLTYVSESRKAGTIVVHTTARSRREPREPVVTIDYSLEKVDGGYRVYDVTTDGESLVDGYRRQFKRIIKKRGFEGLLERMRRKLADAVSAAPADP